MSNHRNPCASTPARLLLVITAWIVGGCPASVADLAEPSPPDDAPATPSGDIVRAAGMAAPTILDEVDGIPARVPRGQEILPPVPAEAAPPHSPRLSGAIALERLSAGIESHFSGRWERRMHVQVDRPLYRPGETVWLRAWDLRVRDLAPGHDAAQGISVALVDPRGLEILRHRFPVAGGLAAGDFDIPAGIPGGAYTLRVRSDDGVTVERPVIVAVYEPPLLSKELELLRRAHGPGDAVEAAVRIRRATGEPLAQRTLTVVATIDGETLPRMTVRTDDEGAARVRFDLPGTLTRGDGLLTVLAEDGGISESISRAIPIELERMELRLFPEGGDLVTGLPSRVYFQAFDAHGKPADVAGRIVDDLGNTAARFESHHHGLGRFDLTPSTGRTYHAEITRPVGIVERYPVPVPAPDGCVLRTFDDLDGTVSALRAAVHCTEQREVIVSAMQRERHLDAARVAVLVGEAAIVYLEPEDPALARSQGVARITVFDADLAPLSERVVYRNRRNRLGIEVEPDRETYGPREKVTLTVRTRDLDGEPVPARLALSVVDDALLTFTDDKTGHLLSRILLEPEVPGEVEEPNLYFDLKDARSGLALELLMGTRGWRRFEWRPVVAGEIAAASAVERDTGVIGDLGTPGVHGRAGSVGAPPDLEDEAAARFAEIRAPGSSLAAKGIGRGGGGLGLEAGLEGALGGLMGDSRDGGDALGTIGGGGIGTRGRSGGGGGSGMGAAGGAADYGIDLGGRGRPAVRITDGQLAVRGSLDRELIRRVIHANRATVRYCYERELQRTPRLRGRIAVRFTIGANGAVTHASVDQNTMGSAAVGECLVSRMRTFQFPEPAGGGTVIVTYPFFFDREAGEARHAEDGRTRPAAAPLTFAPVRTFPTPVYAGGDDLREDFRPTVFWSPSIETRENGEARVSFYLSDAITAFRVITEGVGGGLPGRDETPFESVLPLDVTARLPLSATQGDRIDLPITLANRGAAEAGIDLRITGDPGLGLGRGGDEAQSVQVTVGAGDRATHFLPLEITAGTATRTLRIEADAGARTDELLRTLAVAPRGYPAERSVSGRVADRVRRTLDLGDAVDGTLEAEIAIHPSPVSNVVAGMEAMLGIPAGCFEQTSSRNHPNVLILRLLRAHDISDPALATRTRRFLEAGYRRLVSFESPSHGFEWFGADPASPVLSAYALVQLSDMKQVYDGVDSALLARTARSILDARDGAGGFRHTDGRGGAFARASDEVTAAYVTHALVRSGYARDLNREIARQRDRARSSTDPYVLALATATLAHLDGSSGDVRRAARRLASMQDGDGAWPGADHSITRSGGSDRLVETTALAILALLDAGGHDHAVENGIAFLEGARRGGRWGATQATVLALEALTRHAETRRHTPRAGRIVVRLNGREVATESHGERLTETVRIGDLGAHLKAGENVFEIVSTGGAALPYSIDVTYRTRSPSSSVEAPLVLETALAEETVVMGETVRLTVTVQNPTRRGLPMALARIGLPAGLESQAWQLREHRERGVADFFETGPQEVVVYFRGLEPREARTVPLDLVAAVPGRYEAPASSAYLYYTDQEKHWAPPVSVVVTRP
jgi:TonB family protein